MLSTTFIKHKDISPQLLGAVAALKSVRWPYTLDEQLSWMEKNIEAEDWHLLLQQGDELVAYMNLVQVNPLIDEVMVQALGIGNVCTKESGKGYGNHLMAAVNRFLSENHLGGMLFCKDHLVPYYQKFEWTLIGAEHCNEAIRAVNTMLFNIGPVKSNLSYKGRMF